MKRSFQGLIALAAGLSFLLPFTGEVAGQDRRVSVFQIAPERGWMGIDVTFEQAVVQDRSGRLSDDSRVIVGSVMRGGPGHEAGLRAGDVILRVDGVAASYSSFQERASRLRPGEIVVLEVTRNRDPLTIRLTAGERPTFVLRSPQGELTVVQLDSVRARVALSVDSLRIRMEQLRPIELEAREMQRLELAELRAAEVEMVARLREAQRGTATVRETPLAVVWRGQRVVAGAELAPLNPQLARYFGTDQGVLVVEVVEGTPAAEAGLLAGDVIQRVGTTAVESVEEFRRLLEVGYRSPPVAVTVVREQGRVELRFRR